MLLQGSNMSTLCKEDVVMSSEESSSYPEEESELELGLGLSLGGGAKAKTKSRPATGTGSWEQYARILTAKDFPSSAKDSSSSSSSSSVTRANHNHNSNNVSCGTKRTAEPSSPPGRSAVSQVVGWPPVKNYRMNSLTNHAKVQATEDFSSNIDKCKSKNSVGDETNYGKNRNNNSPLEKAQPKASLFVKVNMDGMAIGRKVDLSAHSCYETLAHTLDDMFRPSTAVGGKRLHVEEQILMDGADRPAKLLDGSSDFVITYEDKDGDWMLVGDVPWEMFVSSVRRLRIMRTAEANGLAPRSQEKSRR